MIATASDLGIGQHTVTSLIKSPVVTRKSIIVNACFAIIPLFFVSFIFLYFSLSGSKYYILLMATFVSLRLFSIPFGAVLNATNNFKLRKIIEFLSYLIAAIGISLIIYYIKDVQMSLLALNISFIIGAIATIIIAFKDIPNVSIEINSAVWRIVPNIMYESLPFLINNITALLTYGGFIWLSSFVLPGTLIAKLSVLHSFMFMTMYQIYDVFLRSKQADLILHSKVKFFLSFNRVLLIVVPVFVIFLGGFLLKIIASTIKFEISDLIIFSVFIVVEFCYLIIQSVIQVDFKYSKDLILYSFIKSISIIVPFILLFLFRDRVNLTSFLIVLNIFSIIGLLVSNYYFKLKTGFTL